MSEKDLIFTYQGIVNDEIVNDLLQLTESALQSEKIEPSLKRKICRVLVEGIQNSYKHQNEELIADGTNEEVTVVLVKKTNYYELILGNYILPKEGERLKEKIDVINGQNQEELRKNYREILNDQSRTKDGGSGLGLMDIARKTGEPLNYTFSIVDDSVSYFTLRLKIKYNG